MRPELTAAGRLCTAVAAACPAHLRLLLRDAGAAVRCTCSNAPPLRACGVLPRRGAHVMCLRLSWYSSFFRPTLRRSVTSAVSVCAQPHQPYQLPGVSSGACPPDAATRRAPSRASVHAAAPALSLPVLATPEQPAGCPGQHARHRPAQRLASTTRLAHARGSADVRRAGQVAASARCCAGLRTLHC